MIGLGSDKNYEVAKGGDCGFVVDYDSVTPPQEGCMTKSHRTKVHGVRARTPAVF